MFLEYERKNRTRTDRRIIDIAFIVLHLGPIGVSGETRVEDEIKPLSKEDKRGIWRVINQAARKYENRIPDDCYSEPYMTLNELEEEICKMKFYGYSIKKLVGVIGLQNKSDVFLIRHLYILPEFQRIGVGTKLLKFGLENTTSSKISVGTWKTADWSIYFYEKNGLKTLEMLGDC